MAKKINKQQHSSQCNCSECESKDKEIKRLEARNDVLEQQLRKYKKNTLRAKQRLNVLEYQMREQEEVAKEADFIKAREELGCLQEEVRTLKNNLDMTIEDIEGDEEGGVVVLTDLAGNRKVFKAAPRIGALQKKKR